MAKLTATIMKMYGIRKPLRKKMHQHRPQQPPQNYMKGTNYMKSVANFYRSTTTNSSVGHKSTKQTPRRPASARRSRRSNGQTSRSNRFNQSSQQSPPQSSQQSGPSQSTSGWPHPMGPGLPGNSKVDDLKALGLPCNDLWGVQEVFKKGPTGSYNSLRKKKN